MRRIAQRQRGWTYEISSTGPISEYPALLTNTSIRPNTLTAPSRTDPELEEVTSSVIQWPPRDAISGLASEAAAMFRAVAMTLCPDFRTYIARAAPRPTELPVMNHTSGVAGSILLEFGVRSRERLSLQVMAQ